MSCLYRRCPECAGGIDAEGEDCTTCEGWGGWWMVLSAEGGISVRRVPGDADHRPEACEEDDPS